MKLATFIHDGTRRVGVLSGDESRMVDLTDALGLRDIVDLIGRGEAGLEQARAVLARPEAVSWGVAEIRLLAPIPNPPRCVIAVGKNYPDQAIALNKSGFDPSGADILAEPMIFSKPVTSIAASGDNIETALDPYNSVDYEGELAVVIGLGGRGISRVRAPAHVYGYTIINDVTARELARRHTQWMLGKGLDGFCPMGPVLLTADEVPDVGALTLTTTVNGEQRQFGQVRDLIFDIPGLIETISHGMTLRPGDIIATGTPYGIGVSFDPPRFLRPGDVVAITVPPIGVLKSHVV